MKLVVIGRSEGARMLSISPSRQPRSWWLLKRRQSSSWDGLCRVGMVAGGSTSAKSAYRWDQKAVPHASFSASMVSYRSCSQLRNAARDSSPKHSLTWQPYSLFTCHMTTPGWSPKRWASTPASAAEARRYTEDDGEYCCREPNSRRTPSRVTGSDCG